MAFRFRSCFDFRALGVDDAMIPLQVLWDAIPEYLEMLPLPAPKIRQTVLIKIKAGSSAIVDIKYTVVRRRDWRSTAVKRLRAWICLRDKPVDR